MCKTRVASTFLFFLLIGGVLVPNAYAQEEEGPEEDAAERQLDDAPRVYIDCNTRCDYDYMRQEVTFVRYVRDPGQADVHVLITRESTGGGGNRYEFAFLGQRAFSDLELTLTHTSDRNDTWDETRSEMNRVLEMGFAPYAMQTSLGEQLALDYEGLEERGEETTRVEEDPWNHWVFDFYAGGIQVNLESNRVDFDSRWGFFADRVTADWKTRLRPYFNFGYVRIDQEGEEAVTSQNHRHGFDSYAIRSITDHWSLGLFGDYITRDDRNLNHRVRLNPGVEYSVFPYEEHNRRSITFTYRLGITEVDYYEETIFLQTAERLVNHELEAAVSYQQPWGDLSASLTGSHYLHNASHYRAQFFGNASVRITEGLSLNFWGSFEMIQDQLSLPRGDTSVEDVLLDQRELATDFSISGSIALSYTFGSDFADVVNPRF